MTAGIPIRRLKWPANEVVINTKHNVPKNSTIKFLSRFASNAYKKKSLSKVDKLHSEQIFQFLSYHALLFLSCNLQS